jgi:hypothetical protein
MELNPMLIIILSLILLIVSIAVKPIRKAIGLLFIILGIIECLSVFGLIIGIPSILIGGILLFV